MLKMQSCRLMNGQHQQIRPATQQSQAGPSHPYDPMTSRHSWTGSNTFHHTARNLEVQNAHGGRFPLHNGAYSNRQGSNLQTSTSTYQGASSQTGGSGSDDYYFRMVLNNLQNLSASSQSGNPCLPASRFQVPSQSFHQNSSTQSQPNQVNSNATYLQQDMSANWRQPLAFSEKQMMGTQDSRTVTDFQHVRVQRGMQQNVNRDLTKPISAQSTTATSFSPGQTFYTSTTSASKHSVYSMQVVNNQAHGQKATQHGFSSNLPSYYMANSQPLGNKNIAPHTPPSYPSSTSQKTQQYPFQQGLNHNNGIRVTNSSNLNSYKGHETAHLLAKKREYPLSPATQQQGLRCISAGSLSSSNTPGADGRRPPQYSSLDYREQQSIRTTTMTVPNQSNMQPGTLSGSKNCNNMNAIQFSPCQSGQSLPKSTQSVKSRTQHTVNPPLQQNSVPNIFCDSAAGNGAGINEANDAFLPNSNYSLIGLLSKSSLLTQLTESISPQGKKTQLSAASGLEMPPSIQQNNSSVHSSPVHAGTKAVAVVQPLLSLESQIPNSHASCDSGAGDCLNDPKKTSNSQTTAINREAAYLKDREDSLQTLDSGTQNTRKQPELDANVPPEQNSIPCAVPEIQNSPKDQSRMQTSTSPVPDLSSLPATPWTAEALTNLIRDLEKAQKEPDVPKEFKLIETILDCFWDGKLKTLHTSRTVGVLKDLFVDIMNFGKSYVTKDSVILWQVNGNFEEQMKNYHVLKDDEVFSELPYKSPWLNVSKQLDEIDTEFGFPWSLTYYVPVPESSLTESQKDEVNTNIIPAVASKVPKKVLPSTHFEPVDSDEEKEATALEVPSTQNASPNKTDGADSDPCLSLKIQVLPPEEAKLFYEQRQNEMPQSMDTDSQSEKITSSSMENETPDVTETTSSEPKQETGEISQTKEICCFARLVEMFSGSNAPSLCKCQYQEEQNYEECTNKILDNSKTEHNDQFEIISASKFYPAVEGEDQLQDKEDVGNQIVVFSGSELCIQMIDLTKDDQPESSEQKPQDISQIANSTHSDIVLISDDETLSNGENYVLSQKTDPPIRTSEHEVECGQEQLKSTQTKQPGASVSDEAETEKFYSAESEIGIQILDFRSCEEAPDVAESSLETKEQSQISGFKASFSQFVKHKKTKRKHERLKGHDEFGPPRKQSKKYNSPIDLNIQPALDGVSKCDELVGDAEAQNIASKETVELVLFGSAQQDRHTLTGSRKTLLPSLRGACSAAQNPPEVLTVKLNTLSGKSSGAVYTRNYSVKQQIHEKWWRSFQPTKAMYRNKLKRFKRRSDSIHGPNFKNDQISVSSEVRGFDRHSQGRKMERSHIKRLGEEKKKDVTDQQGYTKHKRKNVMLRQENGALKFSVLPSNFNFKDGAKGRKESTDPVSDPDFKEKDQNPKTDVTMPRDKWCPSPKKRNSGPLHIPKTFGLFHEYQKKYKERSSKDK